MKTDVSIIIPVRNEEAHIQICLDAIAGQNTDLTFEVLVIDSGSTDNTRKIVRKNTGVKLVCIKPEDFGHGKTRNEGARLTNGEYIVFLNGDAIPANNEWLAGLMKCLADDHSLAGAFSRHLPRQDCHLYMERDIRRSMPEKQRIFTRADLGSTLLFSTVSCVIPRVIWEDIPFETEILIAEDQKWASQVLSRGLRITYQPNSQVFHSHNYRFSELYQNKVQVGTALKRFKSRFLNVGPGLLLVLGGMLLKFMGDVGYIISSKISWKSKFKELWIALGSRAASFTGRYVGWIKS